jgi:hypothetical protein
MFQEALKKLELSEVATIIDQVNPVLDNIRFDPVETTIMAIDLDFYPGFKFLDISDHTVSPPTRRFALYSMGKVVPLNFSNDPIYELNRDLPIKLNEENVLDYARFFFSYVRGRHGRFLITEGVDDINWREDPPPAARKAIGKMLQPLELKKSGGSKYHISSCMMFKDSLFKSDIHITSDGFVSLVNEELLIEDMPVLDDTFGQ